MENWVGSLAAAIPVAAIVSAGVTLWLRGRDRPQAHWVGEKLDFKPPKAPKSVLEHALANEVPSAALVVSNAGDADAYALRVEGVNCEPFFLVFDSKDPRGGRIEKLLVRGAIGDELRIVIRSIPGVPFDEATATVRLIWLRTPVRHRQYEAQEFDVAHPERPPLPQPWKPPFQG